MSIAGISQKVVHLLGVFLAVSDTCWNPGGVPAHDGSEKVLPWLPDELGHSFGKAYAALQKVVDQSKVDLC